MAHTISIAELQTAGVTLDGDEAIAIVQTLITNASTSGARPPYGPPALSNVYIGDDGSVVCRACDATPAVSEIAILLDAMLPEGAPRVSGALRYTIARALLDVDAPPFDSLEEFSAALARFENDDRASLVRRVARRAMPQAVASVDQRTSRRRPSPALAAGLAIGLTLVGAGELMHSRRHTTTTVPASDVVQAFGPASPSSSPHADLKVRTTPEITATPAPARASAVKTASRTPHKTTVKRTARTLRVASPSGVHHARAASPGVLDRLRLQWIRKITFRDDL